MANTRRQGKIICQKGTLIFLHQTHMHPFFPLPWDLPPSQAFDQLKQPLFKYKYNITKEEAVKLNQARFRYLAENGFRQKWPEPR